MIRSCALSETESLLPGYDQNLRVYSSAVTSCVTKMEHIETQLEIDQGITIKITHRTSVHPTDIRDFLLDIRISTAHSELNLYLQQHRLDQDWPSFRT